MGILENLLRFATVCVCVRVCVLKYNCKYLAQTDVDFTFLSPYLLEFVDLLLS